MKRLALGIALWLVGTIAWAQRPVYIHSWHEVNHYLNQGKDTTYVLNFWATWCKPCVAELPHFNALSKAQAGKKLKVMLLSLDLLDELQSKLVPFVQKRKLHPQVFLLNEPASGGTWMAAVDPKWEGDIPATLLLNKAKGYRKFYAQPFTESQLKAAVAAVK